jgi:hypothetical protein
MSDDALALRRPDVPVNLNDLAARKGEAIEIIEARAQVLTTIRKFAIAATWPEDWLLFKAPVEQGGQVVAYLQDCGGDRLRDLYGIEIFDIGRPEKIETNEPSVFQYRITGSGRCKLTQQILENVEGGRSSTDDFCKGKTGSDLDLAVRKAARANLDGNITRELSGLKSVPAGELAAVWAGTTKTIEQCRRGRGFGTRDERLGGGVAPDAGIDPPICKLCQKPMNLKKGSKGHFYSCPNYKDHGKDSYTIDFDKWIAEQQKAKSSTAAAAPAPSTGAPVAAGVVPTGKVTPPSVDEVFGPENGRRRQREPGEEG